jgi:hypothetical protein
VGRSASSAAENDMEQIGGGIGKASKLTSMSQLAWPRGIPEARPRAW